MQIAKCEVRLLGSIANSVPKYNVTPPEVAILRALHGQDSIVRIQQTDSDRRSHKDEYERLERIYGATENNEGVKVFYKMFPASFDPKLPTNFREIGVDLLNEISEAVPNIPDAPEEELAEDGFSFEEEAPKKQGKK